MQAVADLDVLDLAQPAVDSHQHVVEGVIVGAFGQAEVVVHFGRAHQGPDLLADRGQFGRVECGDIGVLVEQLFQARGVAVTLGPGHRRDQVVDDGGVGTAFGLGALAGVVDQERVDQRQIAQGGVGSAVRRHPDGLSGQPLQVAVLAHVHHRMRTEAVPQPEVGGQVVVAGRQIGVVVDGDRVLPEPTRRLHQDHDVIGLDCGDSDLAVRIAAAVDEQLSRRRSPVLHHRLAQLTGQRLEPPPIVRRRYPDRSFGQLRVGQPVWV